MQNKKVKFKNAFFLPVILIITFILPVFFIFAQLSPFEERRALEEELKKLEKEIAEYERNISKAQREKRTLQNQIHILKNQIKKLDLQIHQSNIMIKDISLQIKDTETSINRTILKIKESTKNLTEILRLIYEEDQKSLIEILLSEETLSSFFNNLMALETLNLKSQKLLENIKALKSSLEEQKEKLDKEKDSLVRMIKAQILQKQQSEEIKKEKDQILKMTEAQYQKYLKEKEATEKRAQEIRARIFALIGVREAPKYEEAIEVAKWASKITGIRPAFLLGILTQESRIGKNVGQCYLKDPKTGMGIKFKTNQKWPRVMKPSWAPLFLETIEILNKEKGLNLDPFATPISCWIPACVNNNYHVSEKVSVDSEGNILCPPGYVPFGWGGAMGPAQLMPFNWIGSDNYKGRIEAITGKVADPWDFSDAVLGAALHLKDCRADLNEREAAACYFGGWGNRKRAYHLKVYADPVMWLTQCHQNFIDTGSMSSRCEKLIF